MTLDDLNDIERLVAAEMSRHGNSCGTCDWLASLPVRQREKWHRVFWDGRDENGLLRKNKLWDTQAVQRAVVKLNGSNFPKSSPEAHRKKHHETPGLEA
jgi:hypothetical protein